eukprot:4266-Heterococcus_DN1.PRE.2
MRHTALCELLNWKRYTLHRAIIEHTSSAMQHWHCSVRLCRAYVAATHTIYRNIIEYMLTSTKQAAPSSHRATAVDGTVQ